VLDVPLLFETRGERRCDATAVVSAPPFLQELRVLARPGMTRERLRAILARQMPDRDKRRRADYVIPTGLGRRAALRSILRLLADLERRRPGGAWPDAWRRAAARERRAAARAARATGKGAAPRSER
jgi:dephospho-CoA kinase